MSNSHFTNHVFFLHWSMLLWGVSPSKSICIIGGLLGDLSKLGKRLSDLWLSPPHGAWFPPMCPLSEYTVGMARVTRKNSHQSQMCIILLCTQTWPVCCSQIPCNGTRCGLLCNGRHELHHLGGKHMHGKSNSTSFNSLMIRCTWIELRLKCIKGLHVYAPLTYSSLHLSHTCSVHSARSAEHSGSIVTPNVFIILFGF